MIHKFFLSLSHHFISRWVIFAKDLILLGLALIAAYLLRFNFTLSEVQASNMWDHLCVSSLLAIISFLIFKPYAGIVRHTSFEDVFRLFKSIALLGLMLFVLNKLNILLGANRFPALPYSILIIYLLSGLFLLIFTRVVIKVLFTTFSDKGSSKRNVLIFGAGKADGDAVGIGLVIQAVKHVSMAIQQAGVAGAVFEALFGFCIRPGVAPVGTFSPRLPWHAVGVGASFKALASLLFQSIADLAHDGGEVAHAGLELFQLGTKGAVFYGDDEHEIPLS